MPTQSLTAVQRQVVGWFEVSTPAAFSTEAFLACVCSLAASRDSAAPMECPSRTLHAWVCGCPWKRYLALHQPCWCVECSGAEGGCQEVLPQGGRAHVPCSGLHVHQQHRLAIHHRLPPLPPRGVLSCSKSCANSSLEHQRACSLAPLRAAPSMQGACLRRSSCARPAAGTASSSAA